jgi:hypothetical protein
VLEKSQDQLVNGYIIDAKKTFIPFNSAHGRKVKRVEEIQIELSNLKKTLKG